MTVAERVKQESMYGSAPLGPQKVDVVEIYRWPFVECSTVTLNDAF